ncbi:MAG: hypothetical protein H8E45_02660 [Proteobacteria bacterium]|nr:hypothetical protein [Pseudomonadota bacterium]
MAGKETDRGVGDGGQGLLAEDEAEQSAPGSTTGEASAKVPRVAEVAEVETWLEDMADELAEVIGRAEAVEQEGLHDYAVALVRDRLPVAEATAGRASSNKEGEDSLGGRGTGVSSFGLGVLLCIVGPLLIPVFPPIGTIFLFVGMGLLAWGLLVMLLQKFWSGMTGSWAGNGDDGSSAAGSDREEK